MPSGTENVATGFSKDLCARVRMSFQMGAAILRDSAFGESGELSALPTHTPAIRDGVYPSVQRLSGLRSVHAPLSSRLRHLLLVPVFAAVRYPGIESTLCQYSFGRAATSLKTEVIWYATRGSSTVCVSSSFHSYRMLPLRSVILRIVLSIPG